MPEAENTVRIAGKHRRVVAQRAHRRLQIGHAPRRCTAGIAVHLATATSGVHVHESRLQIARKPVRAIRSGSFLRRVAGRVDGHDNGSGLGRVIAHLAVGTRRARVRAVAVVLRIEVGAGHVHAHALVGRRLRVFTVLQTYLVIHIVFGVVAPCGRIYGHTTSRARCRSGYALR